MRKKVRKISQPEGGRVETGIVQFGDDWPGIFIRGDNAIAYGLQLHRVQELTKLLSSCHVTLLPEEAKKSEQ